jgi:hypothetical protein
METTQTTHRTSFFGLIGHLREEVMRLIRQEVQLAKTEIMEKVSKIARNSIFAAAGGIVALMGAEVLMIGIGIFIGYGLIQAGWDTTIAYASGLAIMGLLVVIVGVAFLMKGINAFTAKSLTPQQTIDTMRELAGKPVVHKDYEKAKSGNGHHESSEKLRERFEHTRHQVQRTAAELKQRAHVGHAVARHVSSHPVRTLAMGLASGYLGGRIIKNRVTGSRAEARAEKIESKLEKRIDKLEARTKKPNLLDKLLSRT